jgi:hypothetical protein
MSGDSRVGSRRQGTPLPIVVLAWSGAALSFAAALANSIWLPTPDDSGGTYFAVIFVVLEVGLGSMGALIASQRPRNAIGWLLLFAAILFAFSVVGGGYAAVSVTRYDASLPFTAAVAWVTTWSFGPAMGVLIVLVPLLFPTGRLPSPRWRPLVVVAILAPLAGGVAPAFTAGPLTDAGGLPNPLGIPGAEGVLAAFNTVSVVVAPVAFVAVIVSLVVRYRHATQTERDQIKWFAYPASVAAVGLGLGIQDFGAFSELGWAASLTALALLPMAIAIAILRHRLLDIDVIINRTLVYGALSVLLAAVYIGSVLLFELLLSPLTADGGLAVAASTLGVVALFQPLRRRIKAIVDRRFYRSRYDAARIVATFMARLRDEVELDHLTDELSASISTALRPASVSVWLRGPGADR